jgi:hypothetical protein
MAAARLCSGSTIFPSSFRNRLAAVSGSPFSNKNFSSVVQVFPFLQAFSSRAPMIFRRVKIIFCRFSSLFTPPANPQLPTKNQMAQ